MVLLFCVGMILQKMKKSACQSDKKEFNWKKKIWCQEVLVLISLQRLPEGRSLNRLCVRCEGSLVILPAHFLIQDMHRSCRESMLVLIIFSADLTII